jgi:outer membrane protein assembly factor BamD (BamD/ComL family)
MYPEESQSIAGLPVLAIAVVAAAWLVLGAAGEVHTSEQPVTFSAEQVLQFAHHLFAQQEYSRAAGEYRNFLDLYPENPEAAKAALRIAECYFRNKLWEQTLVVVDDFLRNYPQSPLTWQARLLSARTQMELGRGEMARGTLQAIIQDRPTEPVLNEVWYLFGLSFARETRWPEADGSLEKVSRSSRNYFAAQEVRQIIAEASEINPKDPSLSGFLAAIVPGAGHLYCDRPRDAALAFIFTGAFAWATVEAFNQNHDEIGIGLALVTLAFYAGNIFSAVNVAHKYNDREERRLRDRLAPYDNVSSYPQRSSPLILAWKFSF